MRRRVGIDKGGDELFRERRGWEGCRGADEKVRK